MPATLEEHLFAPGPKRVLALDGGGISVPGLFCIIAKYKMGFYM